MEKPAIVHFSNNTTATIFWADAIANLAETLGEFGQEVDRPVLVIVGGASRVSAESMARLQSLFTHVLAPIAESVNAYVIDGGTDAGVMRMMGQARHEIGATFPLVGVVPIGVAILPDRTAPCPDAADLEPHHTHFVIVPGSAWGDESPWIAEIASVLSGDFPSVTVLINGGEVTWQDASESVQAERPIVVVAGSGRTADKLAAALDGRILDDRALEIMESGLMRAVALENADSLASIVEQLLMCPHMLHLKQTSFETGTKDDSICQLPLIPKL
jgi:hypothetical protein